MTDILTVGDLIAELSKHPADTQVRLVHGDEDGPEIYWPAGVYYSSEEAAICIEAGPSPEERREREAHRDRLKNLILGVLEPAGTFVRCSPADDGAGQRVVSGNLLWVRAFANFVLPLA
jgi:hypothetical protein